MSFSGAGILPIIKYNNQYYFIIFKSGLQSRLFNRGNIIDFLYDDAGGGINKGEKDILNIAIRELFEESSGLINLEGYQKELKDTLFVDLENKNKIYRCYFCILNIKNFKLEYFDENLEKFNKIKLLSMYNENTKINLLPVNFILRKTKYLDKLENIIYSSKDYMDELVYLNNRLYQILVQFKNLEKKNNNIMELKLKKNLIEKYNYVNYFGVKLMADNLINFM